MAEKRPQRRLFIFDNLKLLLMALVVVGHFVDVGNQFSPAYKSIFLFIYSFHMPLFLFLSGLFHKDRKVLQKILTFITLGYITKFIIWLTRSILTGNTSFLFFSDSGLPWYMFVLSMFIGISYLLRGVDKKILLPASLLLGLIAGYFDFIGDFLYLSRFFVFYPFYILGQMTPKIVLINLNKMKAVKAVSAFILILWLVLCFTQIDDLYVLRYFFTGRNPFSSISGITPQSGILQRLLCYLITVPISFSVICLIPRKKIRYLSDFGKNTLQVYFWHTSLLLILRKIGLSSLLVTTASGRILWIMIALTITVLLSTRYFAFPTRQVGMLCEKIFSRKRI